MKTNRLQLAGIIKGDTGKSSYEYAVEQGYQGTEEEFAEIIKNTLDAKDVIQSSKEEVLSAKESVDASKTDVLKAKQSVDSSKTEVLNSKNEVNNLNTQFEAKVTEAIGDITDAKTQSVSDIQAAGTAQTNKVTTAGTTAVSNVNTTKDQAITQLQDKGSEILESINSESVTDVTGSDIAAVKTFQGAAIVKELQGGTKQEKTSGYNLFDASKLSTTSQGGATVTNNGDGSFTISGTGNITQSNVIGHIYTAKEALSMLRVGDLKAKFEMATNPYLKFGIYKNDGTGIQGVLNDSRTESTMTVSEANIAKIESGEYDLRLYVVFTKDTPIKPGTIKPMIYQDGDGTWEPYTGAAPSPNPEYPQVIKAIGGNGWFDGEWMVGSYDTTTGLYVSNSNFACNCDMIECKEGDTITINMEVEPKNTGIIFYDKDKNFLTSTVSFINQKAPSGSKYFNFRHQKDDNSIESLGQTIVTINNKYAVKLKTRGKNLLNKDLKKVAVGGAEYSVENDVITVTTLTSTANSPVAIFELGKAEDYKGKTLYIKCDNIIASSEDLVPKISVRLSDKKPGMVSSVKTIVEVFEKEKWVVATVPEDIGEANILSINFYVKTGSNPGIGAYAKFTNVIVAEQQTETYEPYKESISYIPLDSPLYEGDKIYLEDGELWEYRENERVVFDGSEDEGWNDNGQSTDTRQYFVSFIDGLLNKDSFEYADKLFCNKFRIVEKNGFNGAYTIRKGTATGTAGDRLAVVFEVPIDLVSNVAEWEEWVKNNPFDLIYKLATPTRKKLGSAEAFNLRTFDERTYIEVVGAKDLNTQNTFIVPKNQLGGLATEAFATSKLNAHKFENVSSYISAEDLHAYGFVEHMDILSPANRIEYVGRNKDFRAMSMDFTKNKTDYGSWSDFPSLVQNKPYMVKPTGEVDYQLDENNYSLKATGGQSDVANTSYDGGAFSKFIKVYVKRWIEGNDRHVRFSYVPLEGYTPCGFIDSDGTEMDYVWLPMFYGATVGGKMRSLSGLQPDINQSTETQNTNITAFSDRAAFYGGPIVETLRDMLYMLFKTTDIQEACGYGNRSGYDSASSPYYGVLPNAVVGGGQFYGTKDGKSLNKIFHSIVLGTYQQYQRDPYYLVVNGRYKVSIDYTYDLTGSKYIDTGIDSETVSTNQWLYPSKCKVVEGFGSIPVGPMKASSVTGYCAGVYHPANKNITAVVLRFGNCTHGSIGGWPGLNLNNSSAAAYWYIAVSVLLKAPATA